MSRNLLFTMVVGNYDRPRRPQVVDSDWDYVCFTDNPRLVADPVWRIVDVRRALSGYPRSAKKRAMLVMIAWWRFVDPAYEICASIGGNIGINGSVDALVRAQFDPVRDDLAVCRHHERDCIYDEAEECLRLGYASRWAVRKQLARYRAEGYPEHHGLHTTGLMIRNNRSERLRAMCEIWAAELTRGASRDQLSLDYAIWRCGEGLRVRSLDWEDLFLRRKLLQIHAHEGPGWRRRARVLRWAVRTVNGGKKRGPRTGNIHSKTHG